MGAVAAFFAAFAIRCQDRIDDILLDPDKSYMHEMVRDTKVLDIAWMLAGAVILAVLAVIFLPPLFRPHVARPSGPPVPQLPP